MTSTQVQYWNMKESQQHNRATEYQAAAELQEANRHNIQTETAGFMQAEAAKEQAAASTANVAINQQNADTNRQNANTNARNADINAQNAQTNARNAATNEKNAKSNALTAKANWKNAGTNVKNAATNAKNAESQAKQAAAAMQNADTNRMKALKDIEWTDKQLANYDRDLLIKYGTKALKTITGVEMLGSLINDDLPADIQKVVQDSYKALTGSSPKTAEGKKVRDNVSKAINSAFGSKGWKAKVNKKGILEVSYNAHDDIRYKVGSKFIPKAPEGWQIGV